MIIDRPRLKRSRLVRIRAWTYPGSAVTRVRSSSHRSRPDVEQHRSHEPTLSLRRGQPGVDSCSRASSQVSPAASLIRLFEQVLKATAAVLWSRELQSRFYPATALLIGSRLMQRDVAGFHAWGSLNAVSARRGWLAKTRRQMFGCSFITSLSTVLSTGPVASRWRPESTTGG
jgi:hypothetical protein